MTPQRTKQAILALAPQGAAISDGSKGDITVAGNVWTVARSRHRGWGLQTSRITRLRPKPKPKRALQRTST